MRRFQMDVPFCLEIEGNGFAFLKFIRLCCPGGLAALAALLPWRQCTLAACFAVLARYEKNACNNAISGRLSTLKTFSNV